MAPEIGLESTTCFPRYSIYSILYELVTTPKTAAWHKVEYIGKKICHAVTLGQNGLFHYLTVKKRTKGLNEAIPRGRELPRKTIDIDLATGPLHVELKHHRAVGNFYLPSGLTDENGLVDLPPTYVFVKFHETFLAKKETKADA